MSPNGPKLPAANRFSGRYPGGGDSLHARAAVRLMCGSLARQPLYFVDLLGPVRALFAPIGAARVGKIHGSEIATTDADAGGRESSAR